MAPFTRTLKKSLPPFLCFLFAAIATSSVMLARHYHTRARKAEAVLVKEVGRFAAERAVRLSQQERTFLKSLAERYGVASKEEDYLRDAISIAARMNGELNRNVPAEYSEAKTPWLPPPPKTLQSRDLADANSVAFSLEGGKIELPSDATLYQYSISNPTSTAVPMPMLHTGIRWDSAESMVQTSGLRDIADCENDVDAFIATYEGFDLTNPAYATEIAQRLLRAGRPEEALLYLDQGAPNERNRYFKELEWSDVRIGVFDALGRKDDAQALRFLQDQFFAITELQVPADNDAAIGMCKSLGFEQVDTGHVYRRTS